MIAAPSFGQDRVGSSVPPATRPSAVGDVERVDDLAVEHEALDVGEEEQPVGVHADGDRGGGIVGVDVQRPGGERRDHRDLPGVERCARGAAARSTIGSPTRPSSGTGSARRPTSWPKYGTARWPSAAHRSAFTAASDERTISIPSAVVTRRPPTNSTGMPGALHLER